MDQITLKAYEAGAEGFAKDWHEQPAPTDLHALVRRFFRPGPTADIGCGSGREVAWLCANGYPAKGYDPSEGLLAQARARYPALEFASAALPELTGVPDGSFDNVLCETVIMHLPTELIAPSVVPPRVDSEAGGYSVLELARDAGRAPARSARPLVCSLRQAACAGSASQRDHFA